MRNLKFPIPVIPRRDRDRRSDEEEDVSRVDSLSYFQHGDLPRPRVEVVRAVAYADTKLYRRRHPEAWYAEKKRHNERSRAFAKNEGKRWTAEEIRMLGNREMPDREVAFLLGRSRFAVMVKRSKMRDVLGKPQAADAVDPVAGDSTS